MKRVSLLSGRSQNGPAVFRWEVHLVEKVFSTRASRVSDPTEELSKTGTKENFIIYFKGVLMIKIA